MSLLDDLMIVVVLAAAVWWALSRHRRRSALQALSVATLALAVAVVLVEGLRWQLVPFQVVAVMIVAAAALRRWRAGYFGRWRRVVGRSLLAVALAIGGLLVLLTAVVPALPKPAGPHRVGSEIFRWTDSLRPETLTANASDRRQVIAQAWYPADANSGHAVPYFEAHSFNQVIARHSAIRSDRRIAPKPA